MSDRKKLWEPSEDWIKNAEVTRFIEFVNNCLFSFNPTTEYVDNEIIHIVIKNTIFLLLFILYIIPYLSIICKHFYIRFFPN